MLAVVVMRNRVLVVAVPIIKLHQGGKKAD
jgi:hypothetical protein